MCGFFPRDARCGKLSHAKAPYLFYSEYPSLSLALVATMTAQILIAISYTTAAYERPQSFKFVSLHSARRWREGGALHSGENPGCAFSAHNFTCERRATIAEHVSLTGNGIRTDISLDLWHANPSLSTQRNVQLSELIQECQVALIIAHSR